MYFNTIIFKCRDKFIYLGSTVRSAEGSLSEQIRRIGIATARMNSLSAIWSQTHLSIATKLRLYSIFIVHIRYSSMRLKLGRASRSLSTVCRPSMVHMCCQWRIHNVRSSLMCDLQSHRASTHRRH